MDKGVKGLLTGDLSVKLLKDIQVSIHKYKQDSTTVAKKIEDLLEKNETLEQIYN